MQNIIPAAIPLARWQAPEWALASLPDGSRVSHTRPVEGLAHVDDDGVRLELGVAAVQDDALGVAPDGTVRVTRDGAVVVLVEGLRFTLEQAGDLGRALVALVERCTP